MRALLSIFTVVFTLLTTVFAPLSLADGAREVEGVLGEGEISYKQDGYEIFFSTFNSSLVLPEIAKPYGIVRSKSKALVNISVLKKNYEGKSVAVKAVVSGQSYDLILTKALDFFEVREQHSVYYLAQFEIEHKIPFYFTVNVLPEGEKKAIKVQFKKILWVDGKD